MLPNDFAPDRLAYADAFERSLWKDLIGPWFPACIDPRGGFFQSFDRTWSRGDSRLRSVVFQARMTWLAATLGEAGGERGEEFLRYAAHGARFLLDRFFEPKTGAFRWAIDEDARPARGFPHQRHSYGQSFAIYALSAVARTRRDDEALQGALAGFEWLERVVHDDVNGGYFEVADAEGNLLLEPPSGPGLQRRDAIGTAYGSKSQNTHLHLLEALTELADVAAEPRVLHRLREVHDVLTQRLLHPDGWLHLFARPDWTPVPGPVSYGHDIEAAHLLMSAGRVLGGEVEGLSRGAARKLIDHTARFGWDAKLGCFDNLGEPDGEPKDRTKIWWVQAEGLLGLARGMELPDAPADEYWAKLTRLWDWIEHRQVDREHGGWFETIGLDGSILGSGAKGHAWKAAYHDGRALLFAARALRRKA